MTDKDFSVAIVGGGIGGLFCAISLVRAGVPFELFEATHKFGEVGAGISFGPNAIPGMAYLGILEEFEASANHIKTWTILKADTEYEHIVDYVRPGSFGTLSSIHRAHMLDILLKRVPAERCHLSKRCTSVEQISSRPPLYRLHFSDGTTHDANVVVGADGIKSRVRDFVLGERIEPRYSGRKAFRGLITMLHWKGLVGEETASSIVLYSNVGKHILAYPIDGGLVNYLAYTSVPPEMRFTDGSDPNPNEPSVQPADPEAALSAFSDMGPAVQGALKGIKTMTVWKINTLWPPLNTYVSGGVALLGDSAHAMTPHCGQGAGQGLEDAYLLGRFLEHKNTTLATVSEALSVYDQFRRPHANRVVEYALESGDVWDGWGPNGNSIEGRRKDCANRMDWIWDYDIEKDWAAGAALLDALVPGPPQLSVECI